ncbi:hypothetical protein P152DRAFT_459687 [Eremomyces bilateralis CBS 781.70]|uniref:HMG box domain-containing protein n=1 Tax=Eremomyces bilateralis CBS 781.70 TaxID=1392243 RepID=A0A6G1FZQ8_9PEZI|nr:uncharacterized protein P152DRAFT_459687 [Eremomyces bilateralis CBS 781.70]KAF1811284.1 hypothetical protein P152DRAFT_459687 [Eremomyces bilateralis CBS 781.70]
MTKPKASAEKPQQVPMVMLSRDDYTKFKNSVVTGLTELQTTIDHYISGLQAIHGATGDLLKAYINHTNAQLGGHPASASDLPLPDFLNSAAIRAVDHSVVDGVAGVKPKRKREKKIRDPNAPRRPSTAYFLFSEHARPTIRKDFADAGKEIKPAEVNEEALRRWRILPESEKDVRS